MPGPKMGPRPLDFDEAVVRQSPTFCRWLKLTPGERLRYACREFIKGHGDDEERLMRRIMIARRNNIRDHELLKQARKRNQQKSMVVVAATEVEAVPSLSSNDAIAVQVTAYDSTGDVSDSNSLPMNPLDASTTLKRRASSSSASILAAAPALSDSQVEQEMDVPAVEATRSYKTWAKLAPGQEFCYNQRYIKGKDGHDWLLKKNIWRRMRYRRENKKMVQRLRQDGGDLGATTSNGEGDGSDAKRIRLSSTQTDELSMSLLTDAHAGDDSVSSDYVSLHHKNGGGSESDLGLLSPVALSHHHASDTDSVLPVHVTSEAAALAASVVVDHSHSMMLDQADASCLTDPDAIAAAVAAGESFGKSQQQINIHAGMIDMDHDDAEDVDATSHLVHHPLALDDAAATAAKLAEAGHLYGTVDLPVEEAEV